MNNTAKGDFLSIAANLFLGLFPAPVLERTPFKNPLRL